MRWLPWVSGTVLAIGVTAFVIVYFGLGNTAKPLPPAGPPSKLQVPVHEKTVTLEPAARIVAGRFLLTAVARKHLNEAYDLVGPALRGGLTRKEWATGANPVIPYPMSLVKLAPLKKDFSYRNHALLEVSLIPKPGAKQDGSALKPQLFFLELRAYGTGAKRHWVVVDWVPRAAPKIPLQTS